MINPSPATQRLQAQFMFRSFFRRSEFIGNVMTLFTGSAIAQAIPVLISPILTRIFTPEDFGVLALYMSITSFIAIIASGRYEMAVMLPKEKQEAAAVVKLSFGIVLLMTVLTVLFVFLFQEEIPVWFNNQGIENWLIFVPFSVLFLGIYQVLNYWKTRHKEFKKLAKARVTQSSANGAVNVGLGWGIFGPAGLVLGQLAGQLVAASVLAFQTSKKDWKLIFTQPANQLSIMARRFQDFPKINSLQSIVDMLQSNGVILLISTFFSAGILGFYSFTFRILKAPLGLIGSSTAQVFYQKASETYASGQSFRPLLVKTLKSLALIAAPVFIVVMVAGPFLFGFIFGEEWRIAGEYARLLSPWLFFNFLVSPIAHVPLILDKQKQIFYISLLGNFLILAAVGLGAYLNDIELGFMVLSATQIIFLSGVIWWYLEIAKQTKDD